MKKPCLHSENDTFCLQDFAKSLFIRTFAAGKYIYCEMDDYHAETINT